MTISPDMLSSLEIRAVVENWAIWRDSGDWERFKTLWHDDAQMAATWFQGPASEFIERGIAGWHARIAICHFLGGCAVDIAGDRAIAQTKTTIGQRTNVHGIECDIVCTGRFYDFFERRNGKWLIVFRQPIYEFDRLDPVTAGAAPVLDPEMLSRFPIGYRHLAYIQTLIGYDVKRDMPGLRGPEVEALYAKGAAWLTGEAQRDVLQF